MSAPFLFLLPVSDSLKFAGRHVREDSAELHQGRKCSCARSVGVLAASTAERSRQAVSPWRKSTLVGRGRVSAKSHSTKQPELLPGVPTSTGRNLIPSCFGAIRRHPLGPRPHRNCGDRSASLSLAENLQVSPRHISEALAVSIRRSDICRLHERVNANYFEKALMFGCIDVIALLRDFHFGFASHVPPPALRFPMALCGRVYPSKIESHGNSIGDRLRSPIPGTCHAAVGPGVPAPPAIGAAGAGRGSKMPSWR